MFDLLVLLIGVALGGIVTYSLFATKSDAKRLTKPQSGLGVTQITKGNAREEPQSTPEGERGRVPQISVRTQGLVRPETHGSRFFKDRKDSSLILEAAYGLAKPISQAAGSLVDLAMRDFVFSWYKNTSPDPEFLEDTRLIMIDIIGGFLLRLCRLDFGLFLVKDVAPILRRNVKSFQEFRRLAADRDPLLFRRTGHESTKDFAERERKVFEAGLVLHEGARDDGVHAQVIVSRILLAVLSANDSNCLALVHLIREIIVRSIVLPILDSLHPFCLNSGLAAAGNQKLRSSSDPSGAVPAVTSADSRLDVTTCSTASKPGEMNDSRTEEDCTSAVIDANISIEENHFMAKPHVEDSGDDELDFTISSIRVAYPDLSLDYTVPTDPVPFMSYTLEIKAILYHTKQSLTWAEKTRYSALKMLHEKLLRRFPTMTAAFPGNRGWKKYFFGLPEYDKQFVEVRMRDLNLYLSHLLSDPYIRNSKTLKTFMTRSTNLSALIKEQQHPKLPQQPPTAFNPDHFFLQGRETPLEQVDLHEVYCLVDEIFLLGQGRFSFFRANIISFVRVIVQTAFKGSLFKYMTSLSAQKTEAIAQIVLSIRDGTWPDGSLAPPPVLPPEDQQDEMQKAALKYLKAALPKQVVSLIGATHRDLVAETCHEMIQFHLLSKSIFLEIVDVLVKRLFPDEI